MKQSLIGLSLVLLCSASVQAQSDVYLCVDANGKREYKNTGITKGCKLVDLPRMNTVPAPASAKKPAATTANKTTASPSNFPKVDDSTQKARDSDRKQILLDELKVEEQKLEATKKEEF